MKRILPRALLFVAIPIALSGCLDEKGQFIFGRVVDKCDTEWPVCDTIAGCLLGDSSYIEGKMPTMDRVAIQLFEPSTVTVSFFLENVAGSGIETDIYFNEDRCRSKIPITIMGRDFVGEGQNNGGVVSRSADLSGVGDHLIEFQSDARLDFLLKVDVLPLRLKNTDMTNSSM